MRYVNTMLIPQLLIFYFVFMILLYFNKLVQNYWKSMSIYDEEYCESFITSLREKCLNGVFFLVRIFLYSDWLQENTDQKKLRICTLFTWQFFFFLSNNQISK